MKTPREQRASGRNVNRDRPASVQPRTFACIPHQLPRAIRQPPTTLDSPSLFFSSPPEGENCYIRPHMHPSFPRYQQRGRNNATRIFCIRFRFIPSRALANTFYFLQKTDAGEIHCVYIFKGIERSPPSFCNKLSAYFFNLPMAQMAMFYNCLLLVIYGGINFEFISLSCLLWRGT